MPEAKANSALEADPVFHHLFRGNDDGGGVALVLEPPAPRRQLI
jgi:hypothetical protein